MPLFHDEMMESKEQGEKFDAVFQGVADAIHQSVRMFGCVLKEVVKKSFETGDDIHLTCQALMFDFAEAIDGVSHLMRVGSVRPCPPLLRTALELHLGLKYLLESKDTYRNRSLSYEYFHIQNRLKVAQKCDKDHLVGKQLRTEIAGHQFADIFDVEGIDATKQVAYYQARLDSARYAPVRTEYERMKKTKRKPKNWFSLWDGPPTVEELAYHFKEGPLYEVFYRTWSTVTHGAGALTRYTIGKSGLGDADPIRSPLGMGGLARMAFILCNAECLFVVDSLVDHLREDLRGHYKNIVLPGKAAIERAVKLWG